MKSIVSLLGNLVIMLLLNGCIGAPDVVHPDVGQMFVGSKITDPAKPLDKCPTHGVIKWKRDPHSTSHVLTGRDKHRKKVCRGKVGAKVEHFPCDHKLGKGETLYIKFISVINGRPKSDPSSCVVSGLAGNTSITVEPGDLDGGPPTPNLTGSGLVYFTLN
jgi:hypothetical protein